MNEPNSTGYTKQEILDLIDSASEPDALCTALDWLEAETGEEIDDGSYSTESVRRAVMLEDPALLERV